MRYNDIDGTVPSATIVLNRVENGDTHMDHDLALSVGGDFVHALSNQMTRPSDRPPRPTALDLLWKVRALSPGIRVSQGLEESGVCARNARKFVGVAGQLVWTTLVVY